MKQSLIVLIFLSSFFSQVVNAETGSECYDRVVTASSDLILLHPDNIDLTCSNKKGIFSMVLTQQCADTGWFRLTMRVDGDKGNRQCRMTDGRTPPECEIPSFTTFGTAPLDSEQEFRAARKLISAYCKDLL